MTISDTRYLPRAAAHVRFGADAIDLRWILKSIWRSVMIARQRRALQHLSDHALKDIGLSRGDIDGVTANLIDGGMDSTRLPRGRRKLTAGFRQPRPW
jgi:uncharacterized protein YjiS (DUF1127 family)